MAGRDNEMSLIAVRRTVDELIVGDAMIKMVWYVQGGIQ